MRTTTGLVTAVGSAVAAAMADGWYAIAGLGALLLIGMVIMCWVIANRTRTRNAVLLITASRGLASDPPPRAKRQVRHK